MEIFAYRGLWNNGNIRFASAIPYNGALYTSDALGMKISTIEEIIDVNTFTGKEVELDGKFGTTTSSWYVVRNTSSIGVNWKQGTKNCPNFFQDINKLKFL